MLFRVAALVTAGTSLFAQHFGNVEGRIASTTTHAGIGKARVTLQQVTQPKTVYNATTDAAGMFRFEGLPRGEYVPEFRAANYVELPIGHRARKVFTVPGQGTIRLDVELQPMGRLSGRVLDNARQPVENAEVTLTLQREMAIVARTGKEGTFSIPSMVPGKWRVQASPMARAPASDAEPKAWESDPEDVHVRPGVHLSGYDIRTRAVPVIKVRGRLLNPSGNPVSGVAVEARARRGAALPVDSMKITDAEGAFEMSLLPGTWLLAADILVGPLKGYGAVTLTLGRADITDVPIRIAARFNLSVIAEGVAAERVNLELLPSNLPFDQGRSLRHEPLVINDIAPGRYRINVRSVPSGAYLESMFLGEQDVLGREVDLFEGAPPLRLVFKPNPITARGTVENGPNAQVVFLPQEESLRGEYSIRTAVSDKFGHYEVAGLRPGNYYVFAFDQVRSIRPLYDPLLIQSLMSREVRVELRKGEFPSVDLKLTPWPE